MRNSGSRCPDFGVGYDCAVDVTQGNFGCWSCETNASSLAHLGTQEFVLDERHKKLTHETGIGSEALCELGRAEIGNGLLLRQSQAEHDLKRSGKSNVDHDWEPPLLPNLSVLMIIA
jgi:hypothetical protein